MNRIKQIFYITAGLMCAVSCVNLDTAPEGGTVTSLQKGKVAEMNPGAVEAEIAGLASSIVGNAVVWPTDDRADDFGFPSCCLCWDSQSSDMVSPDDSYNWFTAACDYSNRTYTYANTRIQWDPFYKNIYIANNIIGTIPPDVEAETAKAYRGIALAQRAWAYLNLVQNFQFKYKGHENDPAVPIVTEETTPEQAGANPRATVAAVYERIMADLDEAVILLENYNRGANKSRPDKSVALGLRARANLLMEEWDAAADDAEAARAGYTFLSMADANKPGFNDADAPNWMWGFIIGPDNVPDAYATWPSQISSLTATGYTAEVAMWRSINVLLYSIIPTSDIRRNWWVGEDLESPIILAGYGTQAGFNAYTNVKFAAYDNGVGTDAINAGDWCVMRCEEMLFIEAEAKAMGGNLAPAKTLLENWVKTYRNPSYTSHAASAAEFRDEVWFQRRVELWGEGHAFFDLQRLDKNMVRFNSRIPLSNYPENFQFNLANNNPIRLLTIPQREINANNGITEEQNNPGESLLPIAPNAGAGLLDGVTN
ncbi:MAG: RagB/SusD family nutrient uptake outer membrane protein [Bacteroidales bacterium]|nr:RagB/SusD family nutrient uptake outer membrane protein [Bacteroidales bacterium]MDD3990254.1 RagB/SusD family nutrient uptake outer membrane protein [Bacteroidales bacterium]